MYLAKYVVATDFDFIPLRFSFKAQSTGKRWVGVGVHLYVSESTTAEGWGKGESILVWLTYDKVHFTENQTRIQLYHSYADSRMDMIAEAPAAVDIFEFNRFEIDVDPQKGNVFVRLNGTDALDAAGILGLRKIEEIALRAIDTASFGDFAAEPLPVESANAP